MPLTANFVRVLGKAGLDVRELPATAGVSREATTMALNFLKKTGYVSVEAKLARLTAKGLKAQAAAPALHAEVERGWKPQRLRKAMAGVLDQRQALRGLAPVSGWLAGEEALRRADERRHRRPDATAAALPDGAPPRRVAGRQLSSSFSARRPRSAPPFPSPAARASARRACRAAACGRSPRRARPRPPALRTPAGRRD